MTMVAPRCEAHSSFSYPPSGTNSTRTTALWNRIRSRHSAEYRQHYAIARSQRRAAEIRTPPSPNTNDVMALDLSLAPEEVGSQIRLVVVDIRRQTGNRSLDCIRPRLVA